MKKPKTTAAQRQREVKVACFAISEELRLGLIKGDEALQRMREVHAAAGWPFGKQESK